MLVLEKVKSMFGTYKYYYNQLCMFSIQEFAPRQYVHDYLQKYADLFHSTERIRFQT
jgi:hypothetical protein